MGVLSSMIMILEHFEFMYLFFLIFGTEDWI